MQKDITILGLLVDQRATNAPEVQDVLTSYGSQILSRHGIPTPNKDKGLITIVMVASEQERQEMAQALEKVDGVQVRTISFGLPAEDFQCSTK